MSDLEQPVQRPPSPPLHSALVSLGSGGFPVSSALSLFWRLKWSRAAASSLHYRSFATSQAQISTSFKRDWFSQRCYCFELTAALSSTGFSVSSLMMWASHQASSILQLMGSGGAAVSKVSVVHRECGSGLHGQKLFFYCLARSFGILQAQGRHPGTHKGLWSRSRMLYPSDLAQFLCRGVCLLFVSTVFSFVGPSPFEAGRSTFGTLTERKSEGILSCALTILN